MEEEYSIDKNQQLRIKLCIKKLCRNKLPIIYDELDNWTKKYKKLKKDNKNVNILKYKILLLEEEIEKIENKIDNTELFE